MIRHRSDGQVVASAEQIDAALAAGLTEGQMQALVAARHGWRTCGRLDPATICEDLLTAIALPAAAAWDMIFVHRARVELSAPAPTVSP